MKNTDNISNENEGLRLGIVGNRGLCKLCMGEGCVPNGFNNMGYVVTLSTKITEDCPNCLGTGSQLK